jgi:mono/diheme cytochrome c family protein
MDETLFYVFGIALVLSALVLSALGLRSESFPPSRIVLAGVVAYFVALVGATTTFAVLNARDEQRKRDAEQVEATQEQTTTQAQATTTTAANAAAGKQVFAANGCGSCHTLKAAGSTGTVGPDLDEGLKGKTADFIRESITDPNAEITEGFPANTMPDNFAGTINPADLDALVAFLAQSTGAKQ